MKLTIRLAGPSGWRESVLNRLRFTLGQCGWKPLRLQWEDRWDSEGPEFEILEGTMDEALHAMVAQLVTLAFANAAAEASEDLVWQICSGDSPRKESWRDN